MWQVYTRRRRIRWLAIGFTLILLVWCVVLYKSLSINYDPDPLHSHSAPSSFTSKSLFLYEISNIDLFIKQTPVKYNYHIFYYPW